MATRLRWASTPALLAPTVLLIGIFFIWPLYAALQIAVSANQGPMSDIWTPAYQGDLVFTLETSALAAVLAVLVGLVLALRLHGRGGPYTAVAVGIVLLPLLVPHLVAAYAIRLLLGSSGPLLRGLFGSRAPDLIVTPVALVVALVWKFLPFAYLTARAARDAIAPELLDAAADLGSSSVHRARRILVPLMSPGLIAGGVLVFILSASQFSLTLVAYSGTRTTTIPMDVFFLAEGQFQLRTGAAIGLAFAALVVILSVTGEGIVRWRARATH